MHLTLVCWRLYLVDNLHNTAGDIALSLNNDECYQIIRDAGIRSGLSGPHV